MNKFLVVFLVVLAVSANIAASKHVGKSGVHGPTDYANVVATDALDGGKKIVNDATHLNIPGVIQNSLKTAKDGVRDALGVGGFLGGK